MSAPKNGTMILCPDCKTCHRISTPKNRRTGAVMPSLRVYECANRMIMAWDGFTLSKGLKIVEPVGENVTQAYEHHTLARGAHTRR